MHERQGETNRPMVVPFVSCDTVLRNVLSDSETSET